MDRTYMMEVYSIRFCFEGSGAIPLREPATDQPVATDADPEWIRHRKNAPAAYLRGAQPSIEVVFFMNQGMGDTYTIGGTYWVGADGPDGGVTEQTVDLEWQASQAGMIGPVRFQLAEPLPDAIGRRAMRLSWYFKTSDDPGAQRFALGETEHVICTTWRPLVSDDEEDLPPWIYAPVVEWTSAWAAGCDDAKAICDAIVKNLWSTGLQYGVAGWTVRYMLLAGGGMCGGWNQLFQTMAASQGVFVHKRTMTIFWRDGFLGRPAQQGWCAIVVPDGGQNQLAAEEDPAAYYDWDHRFPIEPQVGGSVPETAAIRYEFWGFPGAAGDGHCINFLEDGTALYLYDPSFGHGPIELPGMALPPDSGAVLGGAAIQPLKERYLDPHIPYMLGSLSTSARPSTRRSSGKRVRRPGTRPRSRSRPTGSPSSPRGSRASSAQGRRASTA